MNHINDPEKIILERIKNDEEFANVNFNSNILEFCIKYISTNEKRIVMFSELKNMFDLKTTSKILTIVSIVKNDKVSYGDLTKYVKALKKHS